MSKLKFISILLIIVGCSKDSNKPTTTNTGSVSPPTKLLMLRVDFVTKKFEGGIELNLAQHSYLKDSLPIRKDYHSPDDFGYLKLYYKPTNDTIFEGSIIWMGSGKVNFPHRIDSVFKFKTLNYSITKPDSNKFQEVHFSFLPEYKDSLPWQAISNLDVVRTYLGGRKKIGYFLYTPSVGVGNPAEWDWYFLLSK